MFPEIRKYHIISFSFYFYKILFSSRAALHQINIMNNWLDAKSYDATDLCTSRRKRRLRGEANTSAPKAEKKQRRKLTDTGTSADDLCQATCTTVSSVETCSFTAKINPYAFGSPDGDNAEKAWKAAQGERKPKGAWDGSPPVGFSLSMNLINVRRPLPLRCITNTTVLFATVFAWDLRHVLCAYAL